MKIIAHRGGPSGALKENSLEAIEHSLKLGVEAIEFDVREFGPHLYLVHDPITTAPEAPTLEQALKLVDGKAELYIEIKEAKSAAKIYSVIKKAYRKHLTKVTFVSFDKEALGVIRKKDKDARLVFHYRKVDSDFIDIAKELDTEMIGMHWIKFKLNFFNNKQAKAEGNFKFFVYTVNSRVRAKTMKALGADAIFTDYPSRHIGR